MARRRMIDPNFWRSQDVKKLTIRQRLLAVGLFSLADDDGRGIADPPYVRATVFPYDDFSSKEIGEDLKAIGEYLSIVFYEVDGNRYYTWKNWEKWQTVNRPQKSVLPSPPDEEKQTETESNSGSLENCLMNNSLNGSLNGSLNHSLNEAEVVIEEEVNESLAKRKEEKRREERGDSLNDSLITSSPLLDHTQTERQILAELKAVSGYPFDFTQDLDYIRTLTVEFPTLDLLAEAKKWRTYKRDKPLKPKSNARLQFRNWCEKSAEWQQKGGGVNGKHDERAGKTSETEMDLSEFLWKGGKYE